VDVQWQDWPSDGRYDGYEPGHPAILQRILVAVYGVGEERFFQEWVASGSLCCGVLRPGKDGVGSNALGPGVARAIFARGH